MAPVPKRRSEQITKRNKRQRKETKTTPWKDDWEFESVGQALTEVTAPNPSPSQESMTVTEALSMVTVWRARSAAFDALPHAVESTAALTQVYWRDTHAGALSSNELRLAYSSAIVRCVNGFADALQQQRFVAAPVSALCGQLGIPSWVVDVRHEASHNSLPTLEVLRLAATTLLDYLKQEFWIPMSSGGQDQQEEDTKTESKEDKAVEKLLAYKSCASTTASGATDNQTPPPTTTTSKVKPKDTKKSPQAFDTFLGDSDGSSSSEEEDTWEDNLFGDIWGSSIGTSTNRFAALEPPKAKPKKEKKPKKPKKPKQTKKKQPGEKDATDHAKEFIKAVQPQEGYAILLRFLVWGGIGGAPFGRGVLIPGSAFAFPPTKQGILKSRQRYRPLLLVVARAWPGFCASLLVHLVDFVLTIEASLVDDNTGEDAGPARKLFFLSAWIRFLLSDSFVSDVLPQSSGKKTKGQELMLAEFDDTMALDYPLNSLCDRCSQHTDHLELRQTSRDVLESLKQILGDKRMANYGTALMEPAQSEPVPVETPVIGPVTKQGNLCLDDFEAMLSDDESDTAEQGPQTDAGEKGTEGPEPVEGADPNPASPNDTTMNDAKDVAGGNTDLNARRPAWVRCATWDACSLGSLPGYPE